VLQECENERGDHREHEAERDEGEQEADHRPEHRPVGGSPAHFDWAPVGVVGGIVLIGLGAGAWILIRRRTPKKVLWDGVDADALIAALDDSLDDLRDEPDARRAVIAAYARMEGALAYEGLARRKAEAPREYLARTLPALGAGAGSVGRLTALFEEAKFSSHEVDSGMKDTDGEAEDTASARDSSTRSSADAPGRPSSGSNRDSRDRRRVYSYLRSQ